MLLEPISEADLGLPQHPRWSALDVAATLDPSLYMNDNSVRFFFQQ